MDEIPIPDSLKRERPTVPAVAPQETEIVMPGALPDTLIDELRPIADRIRGRIRQATEDIIATGTDLLKAKQRLAHGQFSKWIEREFDWTDRTARNYMQAAARFAGKSEIISVLPPTTVYKLASPKTPADLVDRVIEKIEAGEEVYAAGVESMVKSAQRDVVVAEHRKASRRKETPEEAKRREKREAKLTADAVARSTEIDAMVDRVVELMSPVNPGYYREIAGVIRKASWRLADALEALADDQPSPFVTGDGAQP